MRSKINKNDSPIRFSGITGAVIAAALVVLTSCQGTPPVAGTGTGTGVGNGVIMGSVVYSDSSAVEGAVVRLRTQNFCADTSGKPTVILNDTIVTTATDSIGRFRINSVDTGKTYLIEVYDEKHGRQGTLYKVRVDKPDTMRLERRILTPQKILSGRIILSGLPRNAYVLIHGLERVERTDSAGGFVFQDLPMGHCEEGECELNLRILIPDGAGAMKTIDTELEIEFDAQGAIKEVEVELDD